MSFANIVRKHISPPTSPFLSYFLHFLIKDRKGFSQINLVSKEITLLKNVSCMVEMVWGLKTNKAMYIWRNLN